MSIAYEVRNTQANHSDKCEIVITNPCFNVRFYPTDIISLNSFSTESDESVLRSKNLNMIANYINKIKASENEFMSGFSQNLENNLTLLWQNEPQQFKLKKLPALHLACANGDVDLVRRLIEKDKCDPMKPDANEFFPLHYSVINNQIVCAKLLLSVYACWPNVVDKNKMSPLHHACLFGFVDIVKLLIEHPDIDIICKDSDGKTCLDLCEKVNSSSSKICFDLIKNHLKKPQRQVSVRLMDGSQINLDLVSGSNTTTEQLQKQLYFKLGIDEYHSPMLCLWICSKHLKLQLKPDHKPLQHLADWKRCIVQQLTNLDPLKEEPNLMFMRDARCSLKYEKKISNPSLIRLLCFEAYHNFIHSMYPVNDQDSIVLSAIFMKIVNDNFNIKQWKEFLNTDEKNLRLFVPIKKSHKKSPLEWTKLILNEFEKSHSHSNSPNQTKFQLKFLAYCWNLSIYGSAYFEAAVLLANSKFQNVYICVNGNGVHILNKQTRSLEIFYTYSEILWRVHHSPGSIELYCQKAKQCILLYSKQYNLINHLMLKLDSH